MKRRHLLQVAALAGCSTKAAPSPHPSALPDRDVVLSARPLGDSPWPAQDPFLFCAHHVDAYPEGGDDLGPLADLEGRDLGRDFSGKDGFSMYHGRHVPGFPRHPHRGFETVTIVRSGLVDHSDSMGARARYGEGDVQWLTAGDGILHAEMFPLVHQAAPNPLDLFQIWLNLPAAKKRVAPHFAMHWGHTVPKTTLFDELGNTSTLTVYAGALFEQIGAEPPPNSWAAEASNAVQIATLEMNPGASVRLPPTAPRAHRTLYVYAGSDVQIGERALSCPVAVEVLPDAEIPILAGRGNVKLLMLSGVPIGEPVASRGPFVMNTERELRQAELDYRSGGFGGWRFADAAPIHGRERRFAERPGSPIEWPKS